jgi:hypothetical protein
MSELSRRRKKQKGERGQGARGRGTYGNANLGRMATPERSSGVSAAQRRRVSYRRPRQWQANGAVILNEEDGHAQTGLLDIPTPIGLVRWGPDLLGDNLVDLRGDKIQNPEWGGIVDEGVAAGVTDGRSLDHQRAGPSWHVPDEMDVPCIHLEEGFNEKPCVSLSKHPNEEPVATDKGYSC